VDCRGRGNSQGEFEPFANEGRDGYDIVEWLARQAWCDGSVTMWGGSYAGYNQWLTLKHGPPSLKTIVPAAAAHAGVDFPMRNNIFFPYVMQWLTFTSGATPNTSLFNDASFWIAKWREGYLRQLSFNQLDQLVGNTTTHFATWMQHPTPDAYWDQMALGSEDYDRINLPILTITGHYDGDQPGALHYYRLHMRSASPTRDQHYLIIGPWDHAGTRTPNKQVGGLTLGDACLLDLNKLHRDWYDWTLKGGAKPEFLKDRVAYYVMGADEWKYAGSLDSIANAVQHLYLSSLDGRANDVFQSGTLEAEPPEHAAPDRYRYDPLDVRPAELEAEDVPNYLTDQRYALHLFGNGLVYHSAAFESASEISGCVRLVAWIELDVPDTDIQAALYEILLDGSSVWLTGDLVRARYRESLRAERLVTPGEMNCYEFNGFPFFSRRIAKGSRLRLVINSPNSIFIQKNYNGGGVVAAESNQDARVATVTVYHDANRPSHLELPVVR
jgi:putative CocE/NonD family hydrolase